MTDTPTIEIDLMRDFAEIMADILEDYGFDKPVVTDDDKEQHKIILSLLGFLHRKIPQKPRTIYKPKGFKCPPEHKAGLDALEEKIRKGEDLTPYQSRKILDYTKRDPLLNDWGIQHLHLGTEMESKRPLIKGTKEVLFVLFKDEGAYFIVIADHNTWTDQDMMRILHDNFPDAIATWRMDADELVHAPTDEDVAKFRAAGVISGVQLYPGVVYFGPGGGYATDGTSIHVSRQAINYQRFSNRITKDINANEEGIRQAIKERNHTVPEILKFKMSLEGKIFVISETTTGVVYTRIPSDKIY